MKYLFILLFVFMLTACSEEMPVGSNAGETTSNLSMESFISAYESEGIVVDPEKKPVFGMIGAIDGVMFYNNNSPVKIYEYDSEEAMETAAENFPMLNDWDKNGLFVLETSDDVANEIFNNVE